MNAFAGVEPDVAGIPPGWAIPFVGGLNDACGLAEENGLAPALALAPAPGQAPIPPAPTLDVPMPIPNGLIPVVCGNIMLCRNGFAPVVCGCKNPVGCICICGCGCKKLLNDGCDEDEAIGGEFGIGGCPAKALPI